jgi:hypothetical protein
VDGFWLRVVLDEGVRHRKFIDERARYAAEDERYRQNRLALESEFAGTPILKRMNATATAIVGRRFDKMNQDEV